MQREFPDAILLSENDIERILDLEYKVCIPPIQVSRDRLRKRFAVGNIMLGVQKSKDDPTLVSTIGFRYGTFSPDNQESFSQNFPTFSTPDEKETDYNSAFIYSFNVDPDQRNAGYGLRICSKILPAALKIIRNARCKYIVADGRPSSYNGSNSWPQERHKQIPEFKKAIDDYLAGGPWPDTEVLMSEPTWRVYRHFLRNISPIWIIPDFFPPDEPAGGLRVILYGEV